jgi:hypothetical protein
MIRKQDILNTIIGIATVTGLALITVAIIYIEAYFSVKMMIAIIILTLTLGGSFIMLCWQLGTALRNIYHETRKIKGSQGPVCDRQPFQTKDCQE